MYRTTPFLRFICLLSAACGGCGDGQLFPLADDQVDQEETDVATSDVGWDDTNSDSDTGTADLQDTDTGTDTEVDTDTESGIDTETGSDIPVCTVGSQAEDFDTFDFKDETRQWYLVTVDTVPDVEPDPDDSHAETASGGAYLEVLPDLKVLSGDISEDGNSLFADPTISPQVGYWVQLDVPGRYYVWVRGFTTGGQDNTMHVGIDGTWPASGRSIQLPNASMSWVWTSNQRDSGGDVFGIPLTIYLDVDAPGQYHVVFAMREDGCEFDEWLMTTDPLLVP